MWAMGKHVEGNTKNSFYSSIVNQAIKIMSYFFKEKSCCIKDGKQTKTNQQNKNERMKNTK